MLVAHKSRILTDTFVARLSTVRFFKLLTNLISCLRSLTVYNIFTLTMSFMEISEEYVSIVNIIEVSKPHPKHAPPADQYFH